MGLQFTSTENARSEAQTLLNCSNSFESCIGSLAYIKKTIVENWEGDSADIQDIQTKLQASIDYYRNKIIPATDKLGHGIIGFADAVDTASKNEVGNATVVDNIQADSATPPTAADGGATTSSTDGGYNINDRKWGEWDTFDGNYWSAVGSDFADNWDYSACNSGLDYVLQTAGGAVTTVVDAAETVLEVGFDVISSGASAIINGVETFINWFL